MKKPVMKYHCPYCDKAWETEELAKACAKFPFEIFQEGDVINWRDYKYGLVTHVHDKDDWAGFSAEKNKDYCIALGYAPGDMFGGGLRGHDRVCYAGVICGGKERHESILMTQAHIDDMVKSLDKKLAAAKRLQIKVTKMWKNRGDSNVK